MMDDIMEGKINCVIVKDLSRLGREYIETGRYMRRVFPAYGVRFIAINDNIDTLNESAGDDLTVSVKNIMNEAYARDISIKTRSSLETKRKNGDFVGAFPVYGYRKSEDNHNLLVVDEYAAQVVRSIFRMRLEGFSPYAIANELNRLGTLSPLAYKKYYGLPHAKKGYTDRKDCRWSANTVTRILQDETYTGTLVQGRKGSQHFKLKEMESRPSSEWVRVENAHEAIIDRNDFDLVQRIRNLDTRTSPQKDKVYLFSGILVCGCCGSRMVRKTNRYKDKEYHYYYCPTGKKNGCAHPVMVKEHELMECVRDSLKGFIANVVSLDEILSGIDQSRINRELIKEYSRQIAQNEQQLEQIRQYKMKLYESMVNGFLDKAEFLYNKSSYSARITQLEQAVAALKEKRTDVMENRSERNRWIENFRRFSDLEELDRKAVIQLVQVITVLGKDELQIQFNYQDEYEKALALITPVQERMVV